MMCSVCMLLQSPRNTETLYTLYFSEMFYTIDINDEVCVCVSVWRACEAFTVPYILTKIRWSMCVGHMSLGLIE